MRNFFRLYIEGFKNLSPLGKKLWMIIILKFIVLFVVLKLLFFPDILQERFSNDKERSDFVLQQLLGEGKHGTSGRLE